MVKGKAPLDEKRGLLLARLQELDVDMKTLSEKAGKNHSYIQQYITKGSPLWLPEDVRKIVAKELRMREEDLGIKPLPAPKTPARVQQHPVDLSNIPANIDLEVVQRAIAEGLELAADRNVQVDSRRLLETAIRVAAQRAGRKSSHLRSVKREVLDCILHDKSK